MSNFNRLNIFFIFLVCYQILSGHLSIVSASHSTYLSNAELILLGVTSYENINPNLLVYPLKRVTEEVKFNLLFSKEQKKEYIYDLYEIRLRELVFIINNKKEGFIFFAADRYNSFVGKLKKEYPPDVNKKLKVKASIKLLERLRDIYPANSLYWNKIQQTRETTRSLI